ncbi:MAG: hypothetical protein KC656_12945 [Myxococcales bacterium]|nr:hypothetical protein [Myxococcales bacterium]
MTPWILACSAPEPCVERIAAADVALQQLVVAGEARQPWDLAGQAVGDVPVVDVPATVDPTPCVLLARRAAGGWTLADQPVREPIADGLCEGVRQQRAALVGLRAAGVEIPFRLALAVDGTVATAEVGEVLGHLRACEVSSVDAVVVGRQPTLPSVRPPWGEEPDPFAACPVRRTDDPGSFRAAAVEALQACDCAVAPERFVWELRARLPERFTTSIPLPTDADLSGPTWADSVRSR